MVLVALALSLTSGCTPTEAIELIFHEDGPAVVQEAHAIAWCESRNDPTAVSPGGGNHGAMQINSVHRRQFEEVTHQPWSAVYDAWWNVYYAHWLYHQQGFAPWSCH